MAHVENLGFTLADLYAAEAAKMVRRQTHPEFPQLSIWNYTEEVQFSKNWNNITLTCRGLILNEQTGQIVARPWEKFFNLGERDNRIDFDAPVEVTDKMDGSLGILYIRPDGEYAIATRGSFASDQAIHATKVWHAKQDIYRPHGTPIVPGHTYLFEIIYPDNRIVCNYGTQDDLVLLGGVNIERGHYLALGVAAAYLDWMGPKAQTFKYERFGDALAPVDREGAEGVVIRSGSKMVKVKQADYVELHRIVTNLSPRTVWSQMGEGKTVADICAQIPDEFHEYVERIGNDLIEQASDIQYYATVWYKGCLAQATVDGTVVRKRFANEASKSPHRALLFRLLDGKEIESTIWAMIKPAGDAKLVEDE